MEEEGYMGIASVRRGNLGISKDTWVGDGCVRIGNGGKQGGPIPNLCPLTG